MAEPAAPTDPAARPSGGVCASTSPELRKLRARREFLAANRGRRFAMPAFVLLVAERRDDDAAIGIGITVTKKIGNAVVRNRIKRRFRALAAEMLPAHGVPGADHVLIGRGEALTRSFDQLKDDLIGALARVRRQRR